jgi:hypothetical protein
MGSVAFSRPKCLGKPTWMDANTGSVIFQFFSYGRSGLQEDGQESPSVFPLVFVAEVVIFR